MASNWLIRTSSVKNSKYIEIARIIAEGIIKTQKCSSKKDSSCSSSPSRSQILWEHPIWLIYTHQ